MVNNTTPLNVAWRHPLRRGDRSYHLARLGIVNLQPEAETLVTSVACKLPAPAHSSIDFEQSDLYNF